LYDSLRKDNKTIGEHTVLLLSLFHVFYKKQRKTLLVEDEDKDAVENTITEMANRFKMNRYSLRTHIKKNWSVEKFDEYQAVPK
jgi:hypothetical protein